MLMVSPASVAFTLMCWWANPCQIIHLSHSLTQECVVRWVHCSFAYWKKEMYPWSLCSLEGAHSLLWSCSASPPAGNVTASTACSHCGVEADAVFHSFIDSCCCCCLKLSGYTRSPKVSLIGKGPVIVRQACQLQHWRGTKHYLQVGGGAHTECGSARHLPHFRLSRDQ